MLINPGKFNKKIKIFRYKNRDDYGDPIDDDIEVIHECWASVKNKSGKEQFASIAPFTKVVTSFLIRYTKKKIDTTMKIEFQGEIYDIVYIDNYNYSNEYIEITAEKVC